MRLKAMARRSIGGVSGAGLVLHQRLDRLGVTATALLYRHTLLALTLLLLGGFGAVIWQLERLQNSLVESLARDGTRLQAETLLELRSLYTSAVVERVRGNGIAVTHAYRQQGRAIPLPATLTIELGERIGALPSGTTVRLYSDQPFPWRVQGGPRDAFEREALAFLRARPDAVYSQVDRGANGAVLRYAVADRLRAPCVDCHNRHPDSPRRDWKVGDVRGVLEIVRPLGPVVAEARAGLRSVLALALGLGAVALLIFSLVFSKLRRNAAEMQQRVQDLSRVNAELEQFANITSHDLQEPLRSVTSYLQLLERRHGGQLDERARGYLAEAVAGSRRMHALIGDILEYSRVSRGRPLVPTASGAALAHALANLREAIDASGARIESGDLPTVLGDGQQLAQLLQNLIGNALKFRGSRPPRIVVRAEPEAGHWRFSVDDNGIGMDMQHRERIFLMFQRLNRREEYPGTGIGLAVCKKIVERHGGRIWAESSPGVGSTFYFTLQRA